MADSREQELRRAWLAEDTPESKLAYYREVARGCSDACPVCGFEHIDDGRPAVWSPGGATVIAWACARCGIVRATDARRIVATLERRVVRCTVTSCEDERCIKRDGHQGTHYVERGDEAGALYWGGTGWDGDFPPDNLPEDMIR